MAQANTYDDGSALNREDLRDLITLVEPERFPVTSMAAKGASAKATYVEWAMDALNAPDYTAVAEGADVTEHDDPSKYRVRTGNRIQKLRRTWSVTKEQALVATAGIKDEIANAKTRSVREQKRDFESLICSDQEMSGDNPQKLRGLGKWIQSGAQAINPVPAHYRTPSSSINSTVTANVVDSTLGGVIQSVYEQTGEPANSFKLVCGPSLRSAISELTRATPSNRATYHVNQDATTHRIDLRVDEYHSDFGTIFIMPSVFLGRTSGVRALTAAQRARGFLLDMDSIKILELDAMAGYEQDDEGAGRRGYVEYLSTLCVKSPLKLGKFAAAS